MIENIALKNRIECIQKVEKYNTYINVNNSYKINFFPNFLRLNIDCCVELKLCMVKKKKKIVMPSQITKIT